MQYGSIMVGWINYAVWFHYGGMNQLCCMVPLWWDESIMQYGSIMVG